MSIERLREAVCALDALPHPMDDDGLEAVNAATDELILAARAVVESDVERELEARGALLAYNMAHVFDECHPFAYRACGDGSFAILDGNGPLGTAPTAAALCAKLGIEVGGK